MGATIFNTISQKSKALFSRIAALSRFPFTTRETSSFHPPLQLFERYELQSDIGKRGRLGVGGFGSVWAYLDTTNQCTVAIKVLPEIYDEYQWNNLNRQIESLQNCIKEDQNHGIVAIHDLIRDGDQPYLIMEYMGGGNLKDKLDDKSRKFTWTDFQPILMQIARALDHVHAHHIIHRDVKPANIMLDEDGKQAKLVDFDIAEVIQNSVSIYKTRVQQKEESTIVGSYPYMAPEQFYGNTSYYSDQYSLACIVFECLEGSPAFTLAKTHLNRLEYWQNLHCEIGFNKETKNLGPYANAVLRKALSIKQTDRFENCVEFVKALEAAVEEDKKTEVEIVDPNDPNKTIRVPKPPPEPKETGGGKGKTSETKGQNAKSKPIIDSHSEEKTNHSIRNLFILLGIVVALVGLWKCRPDPLPWEDIKKQWESVQPVLKESGLPVEQAIIRMDNHLKNCKIYKDNPQVLQTFQGNATTLLNRLEPISKSYKKIQDSLSENTKKQLQENENCPDEWKKIQTLIGEAIKDIKNAEQSEAKEDDLVIHYVNAQSKFEECEKIFSDIKAICKTLREENERKIANLEVAKQSLENAKVVIYLEEEWKRFLQNYDSKNDLKKNFNSLYTRSLYKKSIQICDSLNEQLEELNKKLIPKVIEIVKKASESAYSSKKAAEDHFSGLEFPDVMDGLGTKLADLDKRIQNLESSDVQEQDVSNLVGSYMDIAQGYESIKEEYVKLGNEAINNRERLQKAYASLKNTRDKLNEDEAKMVMEPKAINTLKNKTNTLESAINNESSSSLLPKINKIQEEWETLLSKIEILIEKRKASEESHAEWMKKKELLLRYKDQWKPETVKIHTEGEEAEEKYQQLMNNFEFEKAEEISLLWIDNYDKATNQLTVIIKKKAEELEKECRDLIETLNKIKRHTDRTEIINTYNQNYQKGLDAFKKEDYITANAYFENISETLPNFNRQLEVKHTSEDLIKSLNDNRRQTDEPDAFNKYNAEFQKGLTAFDNKDYLEAEQHFGSINKILPEFINNLKISHFSEDCESFVKVEKWDDLEKFILDWQKELPPEGVEIKKKYLNIVKKGKKKQKCLNDFQNANKSDGFESLNKMEKILDDWRQVADDDLLFNSANNLYNILKTLNNTIQAKRWKEALNLSFEILHGDAYREFGKSCEMARNSLDKSITSILDDAKEIATQNGLSLQKRFESWEKVKFEAEDIQKLVPQNVKAEKCIREVQDEKKKLQRQALNDWRTAIQEKATYNAIELDAQEKIAFLKANYNTNDNDYTQLLNIMSNCKELHGLVKDLDMKEENDISDAQLRKITEKADEILKIINPSAFASACKEKANSKQKKRIIRLPGGHEIIMIPVKNSSDNMFWISENEITQSQYLDVMESRIWNETRIQPWFNASAKVVNSFKKNMKNHPVKNIQNNMPVHSITWDEAFVWCEMLNRHINLNRQQFKENAFVLRLPTVDEWKKARAFDNAKFKKLNNHLSEWTIEAMEANQHYYAAPQCFSKQKKALSRIHINDNMISSEPAGIITNIELAPGIEGKKRSIDQYSPGKGLPNIGFRVVWGPVQ